jgi:hypothetical protein
MEDCNEPKPVFKVETLASNHSVMVFTTNGLRTEYDMTEVTHAAETKTSVEVDSDNRDFVYNAEDKTYKISASTLASIIHLAEIGDVNTEGVEDGSLLVYDGDNASWKIWAASQHTTQNVGVLIGANADNDPVVLSAPGIPNQYYQLGWNGGNKISYYQPQVVPTAPVDSNNKKYPVYMDPTSKQLVVVATS